MNNSVLITSTFTKLTARLERGRRGARAASRLGRVRGQGHARATPQPRSTAGRIVKARPRRPATAQVASNIFALITPTFTKLTLCLMRWQRGACATSQNDLENKKSEVISSAKSCLFMLCFEYYLELLKDETCMKFS